MWAIFAADEEGPKFWRFWKNLKKIISSKFYTKWIFLNAWSENEKRNLRKKQMFKSYTAEVFYEQHCLISTLTYIEGEGQYRQKFLAQKFRQYCAPLLYLGPIKYCQKNPVIFANIWQEISPLNSVWYTRIRKFMD